MHNLIIEVSKTKIEEEERMNEILENWVYNEIEYASVLEGEEREDGIRRLLYAIDEEYAFIDEEGRIVIKKDPIAIAEEDCRRIKALANELTPEDLACFSSLKSYDIEKTVKGGLDWATIMIYDEYGFYPVRKWLIAQHEVMKTETPAYFIGGVLDYKY